MSDKYMKNLTFANIANNFLISKYVKTKNTNIRI